jgi:hypothetical protein
MRNRCPPDAIYTIARSCLVLLFSCSIIHWLQPKLSSKAEARQNHAKLKDASTAMQVLLSQVYIALRSAEAGFLVTTCLTLREPHPVID